MRAVAAISALAMALLALPVGGSSEEGLREFTIAADEDDGEIFPDDQTSSYTTNFQDLGYGIHAFKYDQRLGFWRFLNVDIPRGQTIDAAWLEFTGHSPSETGVNKILFEGADEDDSAQLDFSVHGDYAFLDWQARPRTTAKVPWHDSPKVTPPPLSVYRSPDLSPIIEEIAARPGWSPGNAVQIFSGNGQTEEQGIFLTSLDWNYEPAGESSARLFVLWGCSGTDSDGDGYDDCEEARVGTDPQAACPVTSDRNDEFPDAWPPDFDDNGSIDILDVIELTPPVFGSVSPDPKYSPRKDLNADMRIDIVDIVGLTPPAFNADCGG
jgi:hypothetical protein